MHGHDRITPAALMVTASVCLVLVLVGGGVVWNFVQSGSIDGDGTALLLGIIAAANGLLARTWREATPDPSVPQTVVAPPDEPLAVRDVAEPVIPHRPGAVR